ncbi:heavy metal translocating P-type ATPase [Halobacillus halophilus]|uniref:heavy metal translocating P-type ATPase n=1 Tax=Halobacillus halophilus TaxID=1570 RepID=UPI001CD6AE8B|nr:heavy metal translocating P-type ATPase [Halobacillus halophilus]MCA1011542.1 cadmium-translocating P-type ATPase [Halobacillus halophilus]
MSHIKKQQESSCCSNENTSLVNGQSRTAVKSTETSTCCSKESDTAVKSTETSTCCSKEEDVDVEEAGTSSCCSKENNKAIQSTETSSCCSNESNAANEEETSETSSCCSNSTSTGERQKTVESSLSRSSGVTVFNVSGMDCPSCAATIEKSLGQQAGFQTVEVHYGTGKLKVEARDEETLQEVPRLVRRLGFEAERESDKKKNTQTYLIEGMDCGSCAKTIEKHLGSQPKVNEVTVNFSTGKMQIDHNTSSEEIIQEVGKSGFTASLETSRKTEGNETKKKPKDTRTTFSGILLALGFIGSFTNLPALLITLLYAASIAIGGYKPARSAFYSIRSRSLDMNVLMASAAIGAALIGEWFEGAMVVWLFALGNTLQNRSIERTRDSIRSLINLAPSEATVKVGNEWVRKPVEDISIQDRILVKPGEKLPLDGEVVSGSSSINQAPITGESLPVDKMEGDTVFAGTINEHGSLEIRVTKLVEDTTIAGIIHLVEEAQEKKAPTQAFVDRFARVYTPIVFSMALLVMVLPPLTGFGSFGEWVYKGLALLVVACPCALVISTPVAIVSAIGNAAKNGVLIKGGTFLEKAGAVQAIAFDKTGTLTEGKPRVSQVFALNGKPDELIRIAHTIEAHSTHPIAKAITDYAREREIGVRDGLNYQAIAGKGAQATVDGVDYFAGNPKLFEELDISVEKIRDQIHSIQGDGGSLVIVGTRTEILGVIGVADTIREITIDSIQALKSTGLKEMVMLTGDNEGTAKKVADSAGVDRYFSDLMPEEKVTAVKKLQAEGKRVAMVGDGINDAPALATADLGIAMGGAGADTAMETADIVLMADNLEKLPYTIKLSRRSLKIIKQNVWFSLITKLAALLLIFPGFLTLWMAVLSDTGAALVVILNSMRLLRQK